MAIWYVDYEGGAGTEDGTSFANRARSLKQIYHPASEKFNGSGDSNNSASGASQFGTTDEVRIKKSPDPTLVGQAQIWKDVATESYDRTDQINGITLSTTKGQTQINASNHSLETGMWIKVHNNSSNVDLNGIWKVTVVDANNFKLDEYKADDPNTNSSFPSSASGGNFFWLSGNIVEFDDKLVEEVAYCSPPETALPGSQLGLMTAQTNVTTSFAGVTPSNWNSSWSRSYGCPNPHAIQKIQLSSSFTGTGKAAHVQLPATKDLSAYQQISLRMFFEDGDRVNNVYSTDPTKITQAFSLRLCSDNNGDTTVHTIPLNYEKCGTYYRMVTIVKDFGQNLSNNINSIAIYVDTASSQNRYFSIQNIIACKASSSANALTHKDLIGLNTTAAPQWYFPANIFNRTVGSTVKTIVRCEEGSEESEGYQSPGYYAKGCTPRYWPQSYNASTSGSTSIAIYRRQTFFHQLYAFDGGMSSPSGNGHGYWLYLNAQAHPLRISGGWNATDMSSKNAGDMTFIDGETCEYGGFRMRDPSQNHSNGSGAGLHADGERRTCHLEDLYLCRFYGYLQYYRESMSIFNVGFYNFSDGIYSYFTKRIKKFGIIISSGYRHSRSYNGLNLSQHGNDANSPLFLTNSDGTSHSTYDHTTRYVKWAAGCGGGNSALRIGNHSGEQSPIVARFSVINTQHHIRSAGVAFNGGDNVNLVVDELKAGWVDKNNGENFYMNGSANQVGVRIGNLDTKGSYSGWKQNSGRLTIDNWTDDAFGMADQSNYYRGEGYWSIGYGCQVYNAESTVVVNDGHIERRPIFYSDAKFFATSLLIDNNDGIYNHSGTVEVKDYANISGNNYKMHPQGNIYASTSVRNTASGYSLKLKTTNQNTDGIKLGTICFNGGATVTVSWYYYKEHQYYYHNMQLSNFSLGAGLSQVTSNNHSYNVNTTNQWDQYSFTFTPSGAGSAEIYFYGKYTGSSATSYYHYLDDLTVTQA
tara:strand:+ start:709 stop:3645 length:2937 start_codon:yes stop_codon:yes gene_type:complete